MDLKIIEELLETVRNRKQTPKEGSYTNKLFNKGENGLVKKLGEENAELIKAFLVENDERMASEAADYLYHVIVALEYRGVPFEDVLNILRHRHS
ncbi:MAG: phosphoribosyl-ATP diphosphatase [Flexistipes sinusarabici]|uniref:Phosphoribosyl-ATP pyrophosphatase n=2 Tax=Flexistipes sinusarabici TaxID=2352 RepID=A0A5D0MT32_FLESI|nr:MAG: phosphoribosyl-ATP diphosphatase [Flexistipes sinusarabici]